MSALVECGPEYEQPEREQEKRRVVERLPHGLCDAVHAEEPDIQRSKRGQDEHDNRRLEERGEEAAERVDRPRRDDRRAQLERDQRIDRWCVLRVLAVGSDHSESAQPLDQYLRLVGPRA